MIGNGVLMLALRELRRNPLRSMLTSLGIVIGVGAVIIIATLGAGAAAKITETVSSLGRNLVVATPEVALENQAGTPFTQDDVRAIEREILGVAAVAPVATRQMVAVHGNAHRPTKVSGADNAYLEVRRWSLSAGRPFSEAETQAGRLVCILGATVREELFGPQNPLGAMMRLDKHACQVIGSLESKGETGLGADQDDMVLIPLRALQRRIAGSSDIHAIFVSARNAERTESVKRNIEALLRQRRVTAGQTDDFKVRDLKEIAAAVKNTTGVLTVFLGAIATISLIVGGIGIMNIMLVSVTERTREIGIRMAIGARPREVLTQFLVEAAALSCWGGLIGIGLGLGCSALLVRVLDLDLILNWPMILIALAFSAAIGLVFGYLPARRAARLHPIEALRFE